jgi:hypothetical protein
MTKNKKHETKNIEVTGNSREVSIPVQRGVGATALAAADEKKLRRQAFERGDRPQDHGTVGARKGRDTMFIDERAYDLRGFDDLTKFEIREAMREAQDAYLRSLTPDQLQAEADLILGEAFYDVTEGSDEPLPADFILNGDEAEVIKQPAAQDDYEEQYVEDSMIVQGGQQLREQLKSLKPADPYETQSKDADAQDHVLDGIHIVTAPKSSYRM